MIPNFLTYYCINSVYQMRLRFVGLDIQFFVYWLVSLFYHSYKFWKFTLSTFFNYLFFRFVFHLLRKYWWVNKCKIHWLEKKLPDKISHNLEHVFSDNLAINWWSPFSKKKQLGKLGELININDALQFFRIDFLKKGLHQLVGRLAKKTWFKFWGISLSILWEKWEKK